MKVKKKRIASAMAAVLAFICALGGFWWNLAQAEAAEFEITETYVGKYKQYHDGELRMEYKAKMHKVNGEKAYCISMTKTSEPGKAKEVSIKKFLPGDELVMACLAQEHIFGMDGYTANEKYMLAQCMVWYIQRDHIGDGGWRQYVSDIDMSVGEQKAFFESLEARVKEESPKYVGNGKAYENIDVADVQEVGVLYAPELKTGRAVLKKVSALPLVTEGNNCYSLENAVYGVYSDAGCTEEVARLTTDAKGVSDTAELEIGKYWVKEISPPKGFEMDGEPYPVTVEIGETTTVEMSDKPEHDPAGITLEKIDKETGTGMAQGAASLAGARFRINYYDGEYGTAEELPEIPKRSWTVETKEEKRDDGSVRYVAFLNDGWKVSGDELYKDGAGRAILPYGTLTVEEVEAPEGYLLEGSYLQPISGGGKVQGIYISQIKKLGGSVNLKGGNEYRFSEQAVRGDLEFIKIEGKTHKRMAGIPFRITSRTTGESHIAVTDDNGYFSTESSVNAHSSNTNANDRHIADEGFDVSAGVWFGLDGDGKSVPVDDGLGALPYDRYGIEELPCEANEGHDLIPEFEIRISSDKRTVRLGTVTNEVPDIPEEPEEPEEREIQMHTTASSQPDGAKTVRAGEKVTIIDTVAMEGLEVGASYRLTGWEMLKSENAELLINGRRVENTEEFTAKSESMEVQVAFTFDTDGLGGSDLVTFEELYDITEPGNPEKVAEHKDIRDKGQTVAVKDEPGKKAVKKEPPSRKNAKEVIKTGDAQNVILWASLAVMAAAAGAVAYRKRKGQEEASPTDQQAE